MSKEISGVQERARHSLDKFVGKELKSLDLHLPEIKTPGRWGERPGVGVTAEGGRRKLENFLVHLVHGQQANLS